MSPHFLDTMFAEATGQPIAFDDASGMACLVSADGHELVLRADRETGRVTMMTEIGRVEPENEAPLRRALLEANFAWEATAGATLGVADGVVMLSQRADFFAADTDRLVDALAAFITTADHWRGQLALPPDDWMAAPNSAPPAEQAPLRSVIDTFLASLELEPMRPDDDFSLLRLACDLPLTLALGPHGIEVSVDLDTTAAGDADFATTASVENIGLVGPAALTLALDPAFGTPTVGGYLAPAVASAEALRCLTEAVCNEALHWSGLTLPEAADAAIDPLFLLSQIRL